MQCGPTIAISRVRVKRVLNILQKFLTKTKLYMKFDYLTNISLNNQVLVIKWKKNPDCFPFFPYFFQVWKTSLQIFHKNSRLCINPDSHKWSSPVGHFLHPDGVCSWELQLYTLILLILIFYIHKHHTQHTSFTLLHNFTCMILCS